MYKIKVGIREIRTKKMSKNMWPLFMWVLIELLILFGATLTRENEMLLLLLLGICLVRFIALIPMLYTLVLYKRTAKSREILYEKINDEGRGSIEFQFWSKCTVDVINEDKKIRFYGELGSLGFYADASTMRWMEPKLDKPVTEAERNEWIRVINDNQETSQYPIIFLDKDGNNMFPRELTKEEKIRNWMERLLFYFYMGDMALFIFIPVIVASCM